MSREDHQIDPYNERHKATATCSLPTACESFSKAHPLCQPTLSRKNNSTRTVKTKACTCLFLLAHTTPIVAGSVHTCHWLPLRQQLTRCARCCNLMQNPATHNQTCAPERQPWGDSRLVPASQRCKVNHAQAYRKPTPTGSYRQPLAVVRTRTLARPEQPRNAPVDQSLTQSAARSTQPAKRCAMPRYATRTFACTTHTQQASLAFSHTPLRWTPSGPPPCPSRTHPSHRPPS